MLKEISQNIDSDVYMLSTYGKNTNRIWHYLKCFCCFGKKFTYYNCLKTFIPFNGKTQPHKTESFKGERYTAVFYKTSMLKNSNEKSNSSRSSKNKSAS